jgi:hypothetical protein
MKLCNLFVLITSTTPFHRDFASLLSKLVATWSEIQEVIVLCYLTNC